MARAKYREAPKVTGCTRQNGKGKYLDACISDFIFPELPLHKRPLLSYAMTLRGKILGIHYVNLKAMLDTPETSYARLDFFADHVIVDGTGRQPDLTLMLRWADPARKTLRLSVPPYRAI